ncbi:MAG: hypothetical protein DIZ80_07940 [endosymbiont of Galathealinum brachiosum]|uniref:histidine kinase n=1 Tax=endosymbiont of Galathealinum brachiosum TaxID=2200906 RepID=A0A370DI68_9GAMM|nr:MAG: hypothetical protein DIZ80_07940 [endosymbiont of Galathealinum brachiosum]
MIITSLKSHYIIAVVVLFSAIIITLVYTSINVNQSSEKSLNIVDDRRIIQQASAQLRDSIWETDFALNSYIHTSSEINKSNLLLNLDILLNSINNLILNSERNIGDHQPLLNQIMSMKKLINTVISFREDRSKRFPTLSILEETLYPINLEFVTINSLAIGDIPLVSMSTDNAELFDLFSDTLRLWHRMISSFRLFVAYRTETINNPEAGMKNELNDIDTLFSGVRATLQKIKKSETRNKASLENSAITTNLIDLSEEWYKSFKVVSKIHTSAEWRQDDIIISQQIRPLSKKIKQLLYDIDEETNNSIQNEITSLTGLSSNTILNIWILGTLILVFLSTGYYYIQKYVLDPISNVANGLILQKEENINMKLPDTSTLEVNALVNAFNDLSNSLSSAQEVVRLTDKMATVGELASCVAHEINNPLNNMSLIIQFAREEVNSKLPDGDLSKDIIVLQHEIQRCASIVKNLLDFGRLKEPSVEQSSLSDILDESIQLLNHKASLKKITISKEIPANLPYIKIDPSQIHQVFVNLIINAIDFSPENKTINILIEKQKNTDNGLEAIICKITDHGCGVDEQTLEKLFNPFYTTRKGHEGMGLGLSVCYGIIQQHKGNIGAYNEKGNGLTIWFTLPLNITEDNNI